MNETIKKRKYNLTGQEDINHMQASIMQSKLNQVIMRFIKIQTILLKRGIKYLNKLSTNNTIKNDANC